MRVNGPVRLWYRDLVSCLQATFATVLLHAGREPLAALGAAWGFYCRPGEVTTEEFYYGCRHGSLGASLAPHHPVASRWHAGPDGSDPLAPLRDQVGAARLPIAVVDNYHLPFRPAWHDVHAAHLLVVYGFGDGTVEVSDAMPPAFQGPIPVEDFLRSWGSTNPRDEQDDFFSNAAIGRRWLEVTLGEPWPVEDRPWLRSVLQSNLDDLAGGGDGLAGGLLGLPGLRGFLDELLARAGRGDSSALLELYVFGWGVQAQASLHGELLRERGRAWDLPALSEAGRAVESVAHAWTGLRITGAHGRRDPAAVAADLARHGRAVEHAYRHAADLVALAVEELDRSRWAARRQAEEVAAR